ncbi:MAG: hypothetical protein KGH90_10790 [Xanthomonadaceae bacterium]|nr:hypothetical protein [Xanthomonadaceae bacterium]
MTPELDHALCARHPKILAARKTAESVCPMGWGIATGDGWYQLIDALCTALQRETDGNGAPQVVAIQVKEKLGGLRFHVREASERQRAMIDAAIELSLHICESCGSSGRLGHFIDGGVATRCSRHATGGFVSGWIEPEAWTDHDRPWSAR